jgi:hypothetical protein
VSFSPLPERVAGLFSFLEGAMNEWIEWKGGECPVDAGTEIFVTFRKDYFGESDRIPCLEPESLRWRHNGLAGDIVAYRLSKDEGK